MCLSYGLGHYLKITHDNSCRDHLANKPTLPLWPKTSFFFKYHTVQQIIVRPEFFDSPTSSPDDGQTEQNILRPNFIARRRTDEIISWPEFIHARHPSRDNGQTKNLGIFETRDIYFRDRQIYGIFIFAIDQSRDRQISRSQISRSRSPEIEAFSRKTFLANLVFRNPGNFDFEISLFQEKKKKKNPPNFPVN